MNFKSRWLYFVFAFVDAFYDICGQCVANETEALSEIDCVLGVCNSTHIEFCARCVCYHIIITAKPLLSNQSRERVERVN